MDDYVELEKNHHAILQAFISRRIIEDSTFEKIVEETNRLCRKNLQPTDYINHINSYIMEYQLQIKDIRILPNPVYWVLINLNADEFSKSATKYTAHETTYFKILLEKMISNGGEIGKTEALNSGTQAEITLSKAETVLRSLIEDGWIKSIVSGYYTLCERSLADLDPLLVDLPKCNLCHQKVLTVNGKLNQCQNDCGTTLHHYCSQDWLQKHKNQCPKCKQQFK
ncbi:hypothetical protein CYY_007643 [Polysphondylium violaceum]|uniref:Non-structural maintenance of chromosomes element 1 homolog n=1 Tax=Polysphondylium violaceum TaxID=133409 RepID=A0A8J4PQM6_9MYCE|nr:hypothetical protein CYY_007643 [Polysphondylium violaceum]